MSLEIPDILYQDFDLQFKAHPNTGDIPMLKNTKAIIRSVRNLLLTNMYDHPYNPSLYSGLLGALFENFDPILVQQLKNAIRDVLINWEPRVEYLDSVISNEEELDRNSISIKLYVRPINSKQSVEIPLLLERIR